MKRFHIAIGVRDVAASVDDYTTRLGSPPCLVVGGEYALWRTDTLNFSIRKTDQPGTVRHLGWEDPEAPAFSEDHDVNGLLWERFAASHQLDEIEALWPNACEDK